MDARLILGGMVGLLGAGLGVGVMVAIFRGTFSRWLAIRPDHPPAAPCDARDLRARLLALDDARQPYRIEAGEHEQILATWRILDATWQQFFARFHATEDYRATLALVPGCHEVRVLEERRSLRTGPGEVHAAAFQGVMLFDSRHYREWALTGALPVVPRDVASFDFDVRRIKAPLITTTLACGWTWVPVTRRAHLTAGRPLA